jgi:hypothetical protein
MEQIMTKTSQRREARVYVEIANVSYYFEFVLLNTQVL